MNLWSYYECCLSKFRLKYSLPIFYEFQFSDFAFGSPDFRILIFKYLFIKNCIFFKNFNFTEKDIIFCFLFSYISGILVVVGSSSHHRIDEGHNTLTPIVIKISKCTFSKILFFQKSTFKSHLYSLSYFQAK